MMSAETGRRARERITVMSRAQPISGRSIALAALLALVAVLMSLPHDHRVAAHPATGPHATQTAHIGQGISDAPEHETPAADCEATVTGCCAMVHCQPVLSVTVQELDRVTTQAACRAEHKVRSSGSDPGIILPPPRTVPD
jgi:hypothetical protein